MGKFGNSNYIEDLYVNYQITKNEQQLLHYKNERNEYRKYLSNIKKSLNENRIINSKNVSKTMWSIFNSETNKKSCRRDISLKTDDGLLKKDPTNVSNVFCRKFTLRNN